MVRPLFDQGLLEADEHPGVAQGNCCLPVSVADHALATRRSGVDSLLGFAAVVTTRFSYAAQGTLDDSHREATCRAGGVRP